MRLITCFAILLWLTAGSVFAENPPASKSADELFGQIQKLEGSPQGQLDRLGSVMREFETRFPHDSRRWDVTLARVQLDVTRAQLDGRKPDRPAILQVTKQLIEAPDAPESAKIEAAVFQAGLHMDQLNESGASIDKTARAAVDSDIAWLETNAADDVRIFNLKFQLVRFLRFRDPDSAERILHGMDHCSNNVYVVTTVLQQLDAIALTHQIVNHPLDLKLQAIDGSMIDLARLRGKVVLLEFWASWERSCRMEMPNIIDAYKRFHKNGFEIVGISLDRNKEQLVAYTKQNGITWPQYFDGTAGTNMIRSRYGINVIPTGWLLDKRGIVRTTEVLGTDLAKRINALLAE